MYLLKYVVDVGGLRLSWFIWVQYLHYALAQYEYYCLLVGGMTAHQIIKGHNTPRENILFGKHIYVCHFKSDALSKYSNDIVRVRIILAFWSWSSDRCWFVYRWAIVSHSYIPSWSSASERQHVSTAMSSAGAAACVASAACSSGRGLGL